MGGFDALEASFFDTGTAIESGALPVSDEEVEPDHRQGRFRLRISPGLVATGMACLLFVGGFWACNAGRAPAAATSTANAPSTAATTASVAEKRSRSRRPAARSRSAREGTRMNPYLGLRQSTPSRAERDGLHAVESVQAASGANR